MTTPITPATVNELSDDKLFELSASWEISDDLLAAVINEMGHREDMADECDFEEPNYPDDCYDEGEALASAGWGTDEDYGGYGGEEW